MRKASGPTLITNGQLADGNGGPPLRDAAVVIAQGRIAYAGRKEAAPATPPETTIIDAAGGTIMPGLVEAHFHPTYFNVAQLEDLDISVTQQNLRRLPPTSSLPPQANAVR